MIKLKLIEKVQETVSCISFKFKPEQTINWQAGQFMYYHIDDPNPDERKNERFFTISAAPSENFIMLTTRFMDEKGSSFKRYLREIKIGDILEAKGPFGSFIISDDLTIKNLKFCFIAGGIGITPFRSILVELNNKKEYLNITLLYANKNNDFVFKETLQNLEKVNQNLKIKYFVDPQIINDEAIKDSVLDWEHTFYFVSGPEPMVESIEKLLLNMGIPDEQIKRDYFPGYSWP